MARLDAAMPIDPCGGGERWDAAAARDRRRAGPLFATFALRGKRALTVAQQSNAAESSDPAVYLFYRSDAKFVAGVKCLHPWYTMEAVDLPRPPLEWDGSRRVSVGRAHVRRQASGSALTLRRGAGPKGAHGTWCEGGTSAAREDAGPVRGRVG